MRNTYIKERMAETPLKGLHPETQINGQRPTCRHFAHAQGHVAFLKGKYCQSFVTCNDHLSVPHCMFTQCFTMYVPSMKSRPVLGKSSFSMMDKKRCWDSSV